MNGLRDADPVTTTEQHAITFQQTHELADHDRSPRGRSRTPDLVPITGVRTPVGVDTTRASIARVYDYSLGGKDNYAVDRYVFDELREVAPTSPTPLVCTAAGCTGSSATVGIDRFLDLGAGQSRRSPLVAFEQPGNLFTEVLQHCGIGQTGRRTRTRTITTRPSAGRSATVRWW